MEDRTAGKKLRGLAPVTDIVYGMLKQNGTPMHHRQLTDALAETLGSAAEPKSRLVARVHTEINLDNRFSHMGDGMWGLREWTPKRVTPQRATPGWPPKPAKAKRPVDLWRIDDDLIEEPAREEEESDWHKETEDEERPEDF